MKLENGRPVDDSNRIQKEIKVYDFLDNLGINYNRVDHEPADTMEVCKEIDKVLDAVICKNLLLTNRQKTQFYMLMMPDNKPFKTKELTSQINCSRLSFAPPECMLSLVDTTPGSLSVMGLINDCENKVNLLVDEDVLESEYVGCHPNINTSSLKLKVSDVFNIYLPATSHSYTKVILNGE